MSGAGENEKAPVSLKVLYTIGTIESQKFVVKPPAKVEARLYRGLDLGVINIEPCLSAIRNASPDFASICETHSDEYAIYTVDYAEDELPLQSHGKISQNVLLEATGRLCSSKLVQEQLELQFHVLPVKRPGEVSMDLSSEWCAKDVPLSDIGSETNGIMQGVAMKGGVLGNPRTNVATPRSTSRMPSYGVQPPSPLFNNPMMGLPALPPSLAAEVMSKTTPRSDQIPPSSPPVRAKPTRIGSTTTKAAPSRVMKPARRHSTAKDGSQILKPLPENTVGMRKKKGQSPKTDGESQCGNCGVETASTWRRVKNADGGDQLLCNACGLYYKTKHVMRPSVLWEKRNNILRSTPEQTSTVESTGPPSSSPIRKSVEWNRLLPRIDNPLREQGQQPPETPEQGNKTRDVHVPNSIEKLFFTTPERRKAFSPAGSGSAGKWISRVMNPTEESAYFESFLASPTPKKRKSNASESPICSSPPTSSTLFSEISDWHILPHSPAEILQKDELKGAGATGGELPGKAARSASGITMPGHQVTDGDAETRAHRSQSAPSKSLIDVEEGS